MKESQTALRLFRKASQQIPAYQKFLKRNRIDSKNIRTLDDFKKIPLTDKQNYIYSYPLAELFPKHQHPAMAYASSGSSGIPTFWFRNDKQEEIGGQIHEKIFRDIFHIKKKDKTLVIICFAMGIWIAGNYTLASCRYVTRKGYNLTSITPGLSEEDILEVLRRLAPNFKNLILAGYPPFIMNVVSEARKQRIALKNKINILVAGDKFSEKWRTDLLTFLHLDDPLHSLVSIYGSADAAVLGYETPFSIFLRRSALTNKSLSKALFGDHLDLPGLVQYDPEIVFFEEVNNELVLTTNTAAPLVRYNIHDLGRIISYDEIKQILKDVNLQKEANQHELNQWKFPFLVLQGRTDVAATFYALNILPEHIRAGIEDRSVAEFLSGSFFVYNKTMNRSRTQKLYIQVELTPNTKPTQRIFELTTTSLIQNLLKWNIEFRKLHSMMGDRALPIISLHVHGDPSFTSQTKMKGLVGIKGKKPKLIL